MGVSGISVLDHSPTQIVNQSGFNVVPLILAGCTSYGGLHGVIYAKVESLFCAGCKKKNLKIIRYAPA